MGRNLTKIFFKSCEYYLKFQIYYQAINTTDMNQTYQSSAYSHAGQYSNIGSSNLKIFHGEDLTYGDRKRLQQLQQMDWIEQQTREKQQMKQNKLNEKRQFDELTRNINMMRNQLQNQKANKLKNMEVACQNANRQLLQDKLGREKYQRTKDTEDRLNHIDYVNNNDFFTENTATCQSMLGRNRVINYHWKGMNDDQKKDILLQQQRQRKEKQLQKQLQREEDKLFAIQQQENRKALIKADEMKNLGLTQIRKGVDEYNLLKAEEMKRKLHHAYGELHTFKNE